MPGIGGYGRKPTQSSPGMRRRLGMTMSPTSSKLTEYGDVNTAGPVEKTVIEKKVVEESTEEPSSWRRALRGIGTELMRGQY